MALVRYQYTGNAAWLLDSVTGSAQLWKGNGDVQSIQSRFCEAFDRIYGAYFERLDRPPKERPDESRFEVPMGTPYSSLSAEAIRLEYLRKTGIAPDDNMTMGEIIKRVVDIDALIEGQEFQDSLFKPKARQ